MTSSTSTPVPPTPAQVLQNAPFQQNPNEGIPVVRIPIHGPAPFNTLAIVRSVLFGGAVPTTGEVFRLRVKDYPTALTVARFDPARTDQHFVQHSTFVGIGNMQLTTQVGLLSDSNTDFTVALDSVDATSAFDRNGTWLLSFDSAIGSLRSNGLIGFVATSWVLFFEPPPPEGVTPPTPPVATTLRGWARRLVDSTRSYAVQPRADVLRAAQDLTDLDRQLSGTGLSQDAQSAQQAAVDLLDEFTPADTVRLDYLIARAEAKHNLIARMIDNQQLGELTSLASDTIDDYLEYVATPGADLARAARDLGQLVKPLLASGLPELALAAQQANLDALRDDTSAIDVLEQEILIAESEHNVIARLIDAHQEERAAQLVPECVADYRAYVREPGADVDRVVRDLHELSAIVLASAGRTALADAVQQAADELKAQG